MLRPLPVRSPNDLVSVGDPSRPTAHWEGGPMVDVLSYPHDLAVHRRFGLVYGFRTGRESGKGSRRAARSDSWSESDTNTDARFDATRLDRLVIDVRVIELHIGAAIADEPACRQMR